MPSEKKKLVVVGGGELSRAVIDAAVAQGCWDIVGFVDPKPCEETVRRLGVRRLGDNEVLSSLSDELLILAIGSVTVNSLRRDIVKKIDSRANWATIIHPFSSVSPSANLSPGVLVMPGAVVCSGVSIGDHSIINLGATVDHDVRIGSFVHIAPQVALGGGAAVGDDAYVGMGAIVRDHVNIGPRTLVGMGAVVSKGFPEGSILVGVPAKPKA